ncbi:beta-lactamase/transpeptidase-like protein [Zopfia rhizophila CBS 207.26]|uniref:Beta-lactamase/transpeptidase-like protein n=1 Tax=Zopfia rhizophila CBS 207.26 TaxID=1314779 RepID=A0A6A6E908_9PEZI|nr:beta-lactamase/transpeptidase-like protein [Zopfia rhizophila CBS 207.26]
MEFEKEYDNAVETGLLPGCTLLAASKDGKFTYSKSAGVQSLRPGKDKPFGPDTVCAIASCTKIMTAVAAMQLVERGIVNLDEPVSKVLPEVGSHGIITGFDDTAGKAITVPSTKPVTLRTLLCHTSGQEYEYFNPLLLKWRASRGEAPFSGPTVETKATIPLVFDPGTGFAYGASLDWAGKLIERSTSETLDSYMRKNIWEPLGMKDITFHPKQRQGLQDRLAMISTLNEKGEGPALDAPDFDVTSGATDGLGGDGAFASAADYFKFIQAVIKRDSRLLNKASWTEFFRPQLDEPVKRALHAAFAVSPANEAYLSIRIPRDSPKNWCFGGMISEAGVEGRCSKGTIMWGGLPSLMWFIDDEAELCGVCFCQVIPPMSPAIMALHEQFQRGVYQAYTKSKA